MPETPVDMERPMAFDDRSWVSRRREAPLRAAPGATIGAATVMGLFVCEDCGDVIGVYEPLVLEDGEVARTTSRAAEPDLRASATTHYHRECYGAGAKRALTPPRSASRPASGAVPTA
jgi:hypothetical protein